MTLFSVAALANALTSLSLGVIVLSLNPRATLSRIFATFAFIVAMTKFGILFTSLSDTASQAFFWIHFTLVWVAFLQVTQLHFILHFARQDRVQRRNLTGSYLLFTGFFLLTLSPFFIAGVEERTPFGFWPQPGGLATPLLVLWLCYLFLNIFLGFWFMYRSEDARIKLQWSYIVLATFLGSLSGVTNVLLWYGFSLATLGNFTVTMSMGLFAYVAVKHGALGTGATHVGSLPWNLLQLLVAVILAYIAAFVVYFVVL